MADRGEGKGVLQAQLKGLLTTLVVVGELEVRMMCDGALALAGALERLECQIHRHCSGHRERMLCSDY